MTRLLVVIASYGTKNDQFLARVLAEYRAMRYHVDIVVLSNVQKDLGQDVEVRVGLPAKDPWSLPFGHKHIFASRRDAYDLYLYTEDDMLVTERNIEAFRRVGDLLPVDEVAGFFQWETYPDGRLFFPSVHHHFRWLPDSVKTIGDHTFARFTNDHSACYLLTRTQLDRAITSGGFLVEPHQQRYDLLVTAATDPYTQCGFRKVLCLSHWEEFLVAHLPNKYIGTELGADAAEVMPQIAALLGSQANGNRKASLINPETRVFHGHWSKDCYERRREDLLSLLPATARTVLSIGCGWGETEEALVRKGARVIAIPVDPVIAACARKRGVEVVHGDLVGALSQLEGRTFDGVLISGVLHLFPDPAYAIRSAFAMASDNGVVIANIPNFQRLPWIWRRLKHPSRYESMGQFEKSGMHRVSRRQALRWFRTSGMQIERVVDNVPVTWHRLVALSGGTARALFSSEYIVVGRKNVTVAMKGQTA